MIVVGSGMTILRALARVQQLWADRRTDTSDPLLPSENENNHSIPQRVAKFIRFPKAEVTHIYPLDDPADRARDVAVHVLVECPDDLDYLGSIGCPTENRPLLPGV
jgi:hypothetical protein